MSEVLVNKIRALGGAFDIPLRYTCDEEIVDTYHQVNDEIESYSSKEIYTFLILLAEDKRRMGISEVVALHQQGML